MTAYIIGLIGFWFIQDALASIAFYPRENWKYNHTARMIRAVMGLILVVIGGIQIL